MVERFLCAISHPDDYLREEFAGGQALGGGSGVLLMIVIGWVVVG